MLMVAHLAGKGIRWNPDKPPTPNIYSEMPPRVRMHPNEKPLGLIMHIIDHHSVKGDTILDPFMGSGTTLVACAKLGRKGIGIELDPDYFEIACKRVRDAYAQPDLFIAPPEKPVQEVLL